jgi:hypothetical protein
VAESCTTCSSRSRRPTRKLLDAPSYARRASFFWLLLTQSYTERSGEEKNSYPLPRLEPPIIQSVAQRYTTELSRLLLLLLCRIFRLSLPAAEFWCPIFSHVPKAKLVFNLSSTPTVLIRDYYIFSEHHHKTGLSARYVSAANALPSSSTCVLLAVVSNSSN